MSASRSEGFRNRLAYQPALLGGVALAASAALVIGHLATRQEIAARQDDDIKALLSQVIPDSIHDNDLVADRLTVGGGEEARVIYRAMREGRVSGAAWQAVGHGYAGEIALLMAVDTEGRLLGVRVLSHRETPGLGDKIETRKSDWIRAFEGRSLDDPGAAGWAVKKDGGRFDQFTGATITPRAVVRAVHEGLQFFAAHRGEIIPGERK